MFLIPYRVDVPLYRWPIANFVILGLIAACFGGEMVAVFGTHGVEAIEPFVLDGWKHPLGFIGHLFLHGGVLHLVGNMVFLWVFGNAVCEKVGNIAYPFIFLGLGVIAGVSHVLFSDGAAIGASGAINGIVGMFLVWFPTNEISTFYLIWLCVFIRYGWFAVSSYWMILLYLGFDILGAATGGGGIAYWAHLGGFAAGVLLATALTALNWVEISEGERTLLDILHVRKRWAGRAEEQARSTLWRKPPPPAVRVPAPPPPPVPIEEPTLIRFKCACGKALQVKREYAGKTGRCPACGQTVKVPLALQDE